MSKAQKKIVSRWLLMSFVIVLLIVFGDFVEENWDAIRWPAFIGIMMLSLFHKSSRSHSESRFELIRIVEKYLWVKLYLVIYTVLLFIGTSYVIYNNIDLNISANGMLLAIALVIFPIIIIQQKEDFIDAGK